MSQAHQQPEDDCVYYNPIEDFGEQERALVASKLQVLAKRAPIRRRLFGASFPVFDDRQYVVFTERVDDACNLFEHRNGSWSISFQMGAPVPEGLKLVPWVALQPKEWRALASLPCYRQRFFGGPAARARQLEKDMVGVRFSPRGSFGAYIVVSDPTGNVDIFVRTRGRQWRRRLWMPRAVNH